MEFALTNLSNPLDKKGSKKGGRKLSTSKGHQVWQSWNRQLFMNAHYLDKEGTMVRILEGNQTSLNKPKHELRNVHERPVPLSLTPAHSHCANPHSHGSK